MLTDLQATRHQSMLTGYAGPCRTAPGSCARAAVTSHTPTGGHHRAAPAQAGREDKGAEEIRYACHPACDSQRAGRQARHASPGAAVRRCAHHARCCPGPLSHRPHLHSAGNTLRPIPGARTAGFAKVNVQFVPAFKPSNPENQVIFGRNGPSAEVCHHATLPHGAPTPACRSPAEVLHGAGLRAKPRGHRRLYGRPHHHPSADGGADGHSLRALCLLLGVLLPPPLARPPQCRQVWPRAHVHPTWGQTGRTEVVLATCAPHVGPGLCFVFVVPCHMPPPACCARPYALLVTSRRSSRHTRRRSPWCAT